MSETDEFSRLISVERCPSCGGELHKTYLIAPRGFYLSNEKARLGAFILDTMMWRWSSVGLLENVPALKCDKCDIVIVDYKSAVSPRSFFRKCDKCGKEIPIASEECQYCGAKQKVGAKQ